MAEDFSITIYHNAHCGTSRNALAMIRAAGYEPTVVEYLKAGWTREGIESLLAKTGLTARQLMRDKGTPAAELGLLGEGATEAEIVEAMLNHPVLVNRPVVTTPLGAKLCRPSEAVLSLLKHQPTGVIKEDGEVVVI